MWGGNSWGGSEGEAGVVWGGAGRQSRGADSPQSTLQTTNSPLGPGWPWPSPLDSPSVLEASTLTHPFDSINIGVLNLGGPAERSKWHEASLLNANSGV